MSSSDVSSVGRGITSCPPLFATARDVDVRTRGGEVANLAKLMGFDLMPWQKHVADVALELNPDGSLRYKYVVVTVPRQCGKSVLILSVVLHRMLLWGNSFQNVMYNAQGGPDATSRWRQFWGILSDSGFAKSFGFKFARGVADTRLHCKGATMRVLTSSPTSGHGEPVNLAVVDEAMAYVSDEREQALLPAMRTFQDSQMWVVSTAGDDSSVWLRSKVDKGREVVAAGKRTETAYFEWGHRKRLTLTTKRFGGRLFLLWGTRWMLPVCGWNVRLWQTKSFVVRL